MQKSISVFAVLLISLTAIGQPDFYYHFLDNALSDESLLRTINSEQWDPQTQSWITTASTFAYNHKRRTVLSKSISRNQSSGQIKIGETIYRYDDLDSTIYRERSSYVGDPPILENQIIESWLYEAGQLMKYENKYERKSEFGVQKARYENLYEYDQQGIKTSEIQIGHGQYDNPEYKWEQKWNFDQNGCVKEKVEKFFDWDGSWTHRRGDSVLFVKNANCATLEDYYYTWVYSSYYRLSGKTEYELDDNGYIIKRRRFHTGFMGDEELSLTNEIIYERDKDGNILFEITSDRDGPQTQSFNAYNEDERLIHSLTQMYNPITKKWADQFNVSRSYNEQGQFMGEISHSYDTSGHLIQQYESNYEYTSEGDMLNYLIQWNWDTAASTYGSFIQRAFQWNPERTLEKISLTEYILEISEDDSIQTRYFSAEEIYGYRCDGAANRAEFTVLEGVREYYNDRISNFDYYLVADCESFKNDPLEITLFPNPTYQGLNVYNASPLGASVVQILNSDGRIIYNQLHQLSNYFSIDLFNWKAGMYFFQLWTENEFYFGKFVKQ